MFLSSSFQTISISRHKRLSIDAAKLGPASSSRPFSRVGKCHQIAARILGFELGLVSIESIASDTRSFFFPGPASRLECLAVGACSWNTTIYEYTDEKRGETKSPWNKMQARKEQKESLYVFNVSIYF